MRKRIQTAMVFTAVLLLGLVATTFGMAEPLPPQKTSDSAPNPLTGLWLWSRIKNDGTVGRNYFTLEQDGTRLTGKMEFAWGGTSSIVDGSIVGKEVRFKRKGTPPPEYVGTVDGDHMHLVGREDGTTQTMELVRLPAGTPMFQTPPVPPPLRQVAPNGLLNTPPMGWNAWNHFKQTIDDKTVRQVVDAMVSSGMRDAGYIYVNLDDEWAGERDAQGNIHPNRNFPDMKALADYIHSKGMKLGLYSSPGPETCEGHLGSLGHEEQDARSYAAWGADYLKYDWCSATFVYKDADMHAVYQTMGEALARTGRPIVYSLCQYGKEQVPQWGPSVGGNLWRTTPDISDNWKSMYWIWTEQHRISQWNKPGGWNDPDMLEIGNGGMTDVEYRTHFSLWAMLSAPLLAGNDPRNMSDATRMTLINREVVAVDQDPLAAAPQRLSWDGSVEIWTKPMRDGSTTVLLLNSADANAHARIPWSKLGAAKSSKARDLWEHQELPHSSAEYEADIPSHGVRMIRISTGKR